VITGMPRWVGPLGCRSCARSRLTSFREAASRLTFKPSTSPNQPLSLASLIPVPQISDDLHEPRAGIVNLLGLSGGTGMVGSVGSISEVGVRRPWPCR